MQHLVRHLVHVALIAGALIMLRVADIELGTAALVSVLAVCIALFEGGMWLIHRRELARVSAGR